MRRKTMREPEWPRGTPSYATPGTRKLPGCASGKCEDEAHAPIWIPHPKVPWSGCAPGRVRLLLQGIFAAQFRPTPLMAGHWLWESGVRMRAPAPCLRSRPLCPSRTLQRQRGMSFKFSTVFRATLGGWSQGKPSPLAVYPTSQARGAASACEMSQSRTSDNYGLTDVRAGSPTAWK